MPLVNSNKYGANYEWGIASADAPNIAGAAIRAAQLKYSSEVDDKALDGEGHAESITVSKPTKRMASGTFTGYATNLDTLATAADFTWNGRFWIIKNISINRDKGKYAEISIEAESYANVTASA